MQTHGAQVPDNDGSAPRLLVIDAAAGHEARQHPFGVRLSARPGRPSGVDGDAGRACDWILSR
ncbi:MAG TPA: hypothetical protein VF858_07290 [Gemmatimonadaceae bacterium]